MSQNKIEKWDEINGRSHEEKLEAFLETANDSYAILQLRHTDETISERFMSRSALQRMGKEPELDHYEVVYIAPLEPFTNLNAMLEGIYTKFNIQHPEDFRGHSLSVSDIVALKQNGVVSCHYVDSFGFAELDVYGDKQEIIEDCLEALEPFIDEVLPEEEEEFDLSAMDYMDSVALELVI